MPSNVNLQPGCTQVIASGGATTDGRLLHARIMDWNDIDYIVQNPTIFVRQPTGGVPHVVIGFPGNISPYQGMNAAGLTVATNRVYASSDPAPVNGRTECSSRARSSRTRARSTTHVRWSPGRRCWRT